jgi:hypothetical protein
MAQPHAWVSRVVAAAREAPDGPGPHPTIDAAARLAALEVDGCDAAAISLVLPDGHIRTLGSTGTLATIGDLLQFALGGGPSLDAAREDRPAHSGDLLAEERWPAWRLRMARDYHAASVLCLPLFATAERVGVLSMYAETAHAFDALDEDGLSARIHRAVAAVRSDRSG